MGRTYKLTSIDVELVHGDRKLLLGDVVDVVVAPRLRESHYCSTPSREYPERDLEKRTRDPHCRGLIPTRPSRMGQHI